jgi:pimeloyl-ACP methyl ester carboxylesterase
MLVLIYLGLGALFYFRQDQMTFPAPIHDVVFMGRSIGTGPSTQLALEHPDAGGLILESAFTSVADSAKAIWYLRAFPLSIFCPIALTALRRSVLCARRSS